MTRTAALRRSAKLGLAVVLLAGLTSLSHSMVASAATTYTVTTNGDGTVTPCTGTSCTNLRDAVSAANTAGGTNSIVFAASANGTITLTQGVIDLTGSGSDILTITGNGEASTIISGGGVTQIFLDSNAGAVTLADLSLKDGDGVLGGDIKTLGDLTLNSVSASGGVLPTTTTGGVIWAQSSGLFSCSTTTVNNSTISGTASADGGAIFGDTVDINNSTVTGTSTAGEGGAISADCGADVESSTVSGSTGTTADGGAVYVTPFFLGSDTLTIANSTIHGGTANDGGDVYFDSTGSGNPCSGRAWSITASTLTGGNASGAIGKGGAVYNNGGSLTLTRSTVAGNSAATSGGGIYNACSLRSVGSTIAGNAAPAGSGIEQGAVVSADVATLTATILNDTAATECAGGTFATGTYNLDDGTTCGLTGTGDQKNKSASLGPLQSNGGPTQTMGLHPGSPAIAQIPLSSGTVCTTTDQRGVNRQQASANDNRCDVGALEVVSTTTMVSAPSTAVAGTSVTITATITESVVLAGAKPTGTVTFTNNGGALGTAASDPGTATLTTSSLSPGNHSLSASYAGSDIFDPSGGGTAAINVTVPVPSVGASLSAPATDGGWALILGGVLAVGASLRRRRNRRRLT